MIRFQSCTRSSPNIAGQVFGKPDRVQKTAERPVKKSTGERRNKQKTGPDAYRHPGLSSIRFTTGLFTDQLLHLFIYRLAVVTELLVEDLVGCRITEVIQTVNHTVFTYQSQQCHGQTRRKAVTHHTLWQNGLLIGFGAGRGKVLRSARSRYGPRFPPSKATRHLRPA